MLGPRQLQIMEYLWDKAEAPSREDDLAALMPGYRASAKNRRMLAGATAQEIWDASTKARSTTAGSISTIRTILKRLADQGKVSVVSGVCGTTTTDPVYIPEVTRAKYKETCLKEILKEGRDNGISTEDLLSHLVKTGQVKSKDVTKAVVEHEG